MRKKIYYHDTDCGGVVYYGNYLSFFEEARTEFFEENGISIKRLIDLGVVFVVSRQEIDYLAPVRYGETISIDTRVLEVTRARIMLENSIENEMGKVTCRGITRLACVGKDLKPIPLPEEVRGNLSSIISKEEGGD